MRHLASRTLFLPLAAISAVLAAAPALGASSGPDVSSYQHPSGASINWTLVKASGHSFAFVKATEATYYTNPYFNADWKSMKAAGIDHGAYHFARPNSIPNSAFDQANYFISVVGTTQAPGDLPPALDLEDNGGLAPAALVSWSQTFLSTVQSLTGRAPIIYASPYFWRTSMGNSIAFASYPLWLAQWAAAPTFPLPGGWTSWTFWQYTDGGKVPGIPATVDLSEYCCDYGSLSALALGSSYSPAPAAPPANGTNLYATLLNSSGSGKMELHAMSQGSHYTQLILQAPTAFNPDTASDWRFFVSSFRGDGQPDLFGVHLRNTASHQVEVHVVSAASGYQSFLLHAATPLPEMPATNNRFQFTLGSFAGDRRSNLYAIALNNTGSGTVEVHALSEASNYGTWILHSASAFAPVPDSSTWQFIVGDPSGSGDLIAVPHTATGSGRTEVHILSRNSGYQNFTLHMATPLGYTSDSQIAYMLGDHDNDGIPDLYVIVENHTASGQTEVHVLSGASHYTNWIEQTPSALGTTSPSSWQFSTH